MFRDKIKFFGVEKEKEFLMEKIKEGLEDQKCIMEEFEILKFAKDEMQQTFEDKI